MCVYFTYCNPANFGRQQTLADLAASRNRPKFAAAKWSKSVNSVDNFTDVAVFGQCLLRPNGRIWKSAKVCCDQSLQDYSMSTVCSYRHTTAAVDVGIEQTDRQDHSSTDCQQLERRWSRHDSTSRHQARHCYSDPSIDAAQMCTRQCSPLPRLCSLSAVATYDKPSTICQHIPYSLHTAHTHFFIAHSQK